MKLKADIPDIGSTPSASVIIAKYLREAIISGEMSENEPIRQDVIAGLFNVSKIPVREALKLLEAEGLVIFYRNRGAVVATITEPELAQMFEVRVLLESKIMQLAVPQMTEGHLINISRACDRFIAEEDPGRWAELNWDIHAAFYAAANRPFMLDMLRSIHDKIERYMRLQLAVAEGMTNADAEHRAILAACHEKDADKAADLMKQHIIGVCRDLYSHLPGFTGFDDEIK